MHTGEWAFALALILFWAFTIAFLVVTGRLVSSRLGGMWIQVGVLWLSANAFTLLGPSDSPGTLVLTAVSLLALPAIGLWRKRRSIAGDFSDFGVLFRDYRLLLAITIALSMLGLAVLATGPVGSFDAGLYHLSAIEQTKQFGVVPGIANLYFPYGYHNSYFPFTALISSMTGSDQGFRAVNSLLLLLMMTDLWQRLSARVPSCGTGIVAVGIPVVVVLTIPFAGFWVTSPTPDTAVFILFLMSTAYFVDAMAAKVQGELWSSGSIALLLAAISGTVRPLYLLPLAITLLVIALRSRRLPQGGGIGAVSWIAAAVGLALITVSLVRDIFLSGWLWYPLGLFPLPVTWIAEDPAPVRSLALAFNRQGYATSDFSEAAHGWAWVSTWFTDYLPSNVGTIALWAVIALAAAVSMAMGLRSSRSRPNVRTIALVCLPSLVTVVVWFLMTPPALRFAWGPIFAIPAIPLAVSMCSQQFLGYRLRQGLEVVPVLLSLAVIAFASLNYIRDDSAVPTSRTSLWGIAADVVAVPTAELIAVALPSGQIIYAPQGPTFQCWGEPFCTAEFVPGLDSPGNDLKEGFTRRN